MHKLKEMFMNELYEYEDKAKKMNGGKLSQSDIDRIHKLTDTVKNIDKIEYLESEEGYSEDGHYMGEGRIYGTSYARGRRYAKRDSMGRYSRDDGMGMQHDGGSSYARGGNMGGRGGYSRDGATEMLMEKAEEMLQMTHDPKERRAIEKFMHELDD